MPQIGAISPYEELVNKFEAESKDEAEVDEKLTKRIVDDLISMHIQETETECFKKNQRLEPIQEEEEEEEEEKPGEQKKMMKRKRTVQQKGRRVPDEGELERRKQKFKRSREITREDYEKKEKQKRMSKQSANNNRTKSVRYDFKKMGLHPPPEMPVPLRRKIDELNGTDVKLVIMKQLFATDLSDNHDRFSMPWTQINEYDAEGMLTKKERHDVSDLHGAVDIKFIEPDSLCETSMKLREWPRIETTKSKQLVMTSSWRGVMERHRDVLVRDAVVQVWSFRVCGQLYLAMNMVQLPEAAEVNIDEDGVTCGVRKNHDSDNNDNGASTSNQGGKTAKNGQED